MSVLPALAHSPTQREMGGKRVRWVGERDVLEDGETEEYREKWGKRETGLER